MPIFNIKDVNGKVLYVVDTKRYPDAVRHNCKIVDPANNIVTRVGRFYLIAKRTRKGIIPEPYTWLPITHEYYDMFLTNGATYIEPPQELINSIRRRFPTNG